MTKLLTTFIILLVSSNMAQAADIPIIKSVTMSTREIAKPTIFSLLPADKATLFQQKDGEVKAKYKAINIKLKTANTAMNNALLIEPFNKESYLKKVEEVKK